MREKSGAPDQPQDEEQDHSADNRYDEAADAPFKIGPLSGEESKQEPAQKGSDDADDNVLDPALLAIRPSIMLATQPASAPKMIQEMMPKLPFIVAPSASASTHLCAAPSLQG